MDNWHTKTADEIMDDVRGLLESSTPPFDEQDDRPWLMHPVSLAELHGIRRTSGGAWRVWGKRYRTKRLAIEAVVNWYATALTRASHRRSVVDEVQIVFGAETDDGTFSAVVLGANPLTIKGKIVV